MLHEEFDEDRKRMRLEVKNAIIKAQQQYKRQYDKKRKPERGYSVGDLVAIRRTQFVAGRKLASEYIGPYAGVQVNRNGRYKVRKEGNAEVANVTIQSFFNQLDKGFFNFQIVFDKFLIVTSLS